MNGLPLPSDLGLTPQGSLTEKCKAWSPEAREAAAAARRGGGGKPTEEDFEVHGPFVESLGGEAITVERNTTAKYVITRAKVPRYGKVSFKTEMLKNGKEEYTVFVPGKYEGKSTWSMNDAWRAFKADRRGDYED